MSHKTSRPLTLAHLSVTSSRGRTRPLSSSEKHKSLLLKDDLKRDHGILCSSDSWYQRGSTDPQSQNVEVSAQQPCHVRLSQLLRPIESGNITAVRASNAEINPQATSRKLHGQLDHAKKCLADHLSCSSSSLSPGSPMSVIPTKAFSLASHTVLFSGNLPVWKYSRICFTIHNDGAVKTQ